jgi:hypothetical protein
MVCSFADINFFMRVYDSCIMLAVLRTENFQRAEFDHR